MNAGKQAFCECTCTNINMLLLAHLNEHTCVSVFVHVRFWVLFVCSAEYSSKQCVAGLTSALNFNDTPIKIGADVSKLTESQVEENEKK